MVGALVFVLVAGIGGVWFMKHRQPVAAPPEPAPVAQLAPEPEPVPAAAPAPPAEQELTNDNVIEMVDAKVPVALILSQIRSSKTNFNLTSTEVIRLSKAGVPASVIDVMRDPKKTPVVVASTPAPTPAAQTKSQKSAPAPAPAPVAPPPPVQAAAAPVVPPAAVVEAPPAPVAAAVRAAPQNRMVAAPNGTPFSIVLAEDVPSAADEGTPLRFTAKDDFKIDDMVVIAKGAPITGAIVEGSKKKFIVSTKMTMRLIEATGIDGNKIKLRATSAAKTDGPPTRPVETGAKRPKDMAAAAGTEYIAYIDGAQAVPGRK
jgi:serine/threonine-protein kinase